MGIAWFVLVEGRGFGTGSYSPGWLLLGMTLHGPIYKRRD